MKHDPILSRFQEWAQDNSWHLRLVHALPIPGQVEHERECVVCQEGLRLAVAALTPPQLEECIRLAAKAGLEFHQRQAAKGASA